MGYTAVSGTELEFILFDDTYEAASNSNYQGLTPANQYNLDYSILGGTRVEPVIRDIRNHMYAAGMDVETSKGECNLDDLASGPLALSKHRFRHPLVVLAWLAASPLLAQATDPLPSWNAPVRRRRSWRSWNA